MIASYLVAGASLALLVTAGGFDLFALWNALPVLGGLIFRVTGPQPRLRPSPSFGFIAGASLVSGAFHIAWLLDYRGLATEGSTAGLIFIFIPFYAVLGGAVLAALAFAFGRPIGRRDVP